MRSVSYDCNTPLGKIPFEGRPTVALAIMCRGAVLLGQSAKGMNWIFPQGGIDPSKGDKTILDAALREGREEIGLTRDAFCGKREPRTLGSILNPIPAERGAWYTHKEIVFIAVEVYRRDWVKPSREILKVQWVANPEHLVQLVGRMQEFRPEKCRGILETARELLGWRCDNLVPA